MDKPWGITEHYQFRKIFNDPYVNLPKKVEEDVKSWEISRFRYHGMYTVIENEWVTPLANWIKSTLNDPKINDECYEVMSGRGWLAKALELNGVEIKATDDGSDYLHRKDKLDYEPIITEAVYEVELMSANKVADFITQVSNEENQRFITIICYPPDNEDAVKFVKRLPKDTIVIYIGDEEFENTASISFKCAITWLDEPQNKNHPDAYRTKDFPVDTEIEGVGSDEKEEKTVTGVIKLGVI